MSSGEQTRPDVLVYCRDAIDTSILCAFLDYEDMFDEVYLHEMSRRLLTTNVYGLSFCHTSNGSPVFESKYQFELGACLNHVCDALPPWPTAVRGDPSGEAAAVALMASFGAGIDKVFLLDFFLAAAKLNMDSNVQCSDFISLMVKGCMGSRDGWDQRLLRCALAADNARRDTAAVGRMLEDLASHQVICRSAAARHLDPFARMHTIGQRWKLGIDVGGVRRD